MYLQREKRSSYLFIKDIIKILKDIDTMYEKIAAKYNCQGDLTKNSPNFKTI